MTDMAKVKELGARITVKCNKCGKTAPIDKERSTENWTVYKMNEPCECGGKFITVPNFSCSNGKM